MGFSRPLQSNWSIGPLGTRSQRSSFRGISRGRWRGRRFLSLWPVQGSDDPSAQARKTHRKSRRSFYGDSKDVGGNYSNESRENWITTTRAGMEYPIQMAKLCRIAQFERAQIRFTFCKYHNCQLISWEMVICHQRQHKHYSFVW